MTFWGLCWILHCTNGGPGGSEATRKGFSRIGSGVAGDPYLGPTWFQLEASWKPLGATMGST